MKINFIITKDNIIIKLNELKYKIPATIYASSLHDEICFFIAKNKIDNIESNNFKLYVNLLLLKSKKTRELTSLIYLITNNLIEVKEINCNYVDKIFFENFLDIKYNIKYNIFFKEYNLIDKKYKYCVFPIKMILHKFYRILKNKVEYRESLIKTYVEDTIKFYPEHINNSIIYIYPFNLNINRQRKFIKYCKENHVKRYSLMGNPYSILAYLFSLVFGKSDFAVIDAERKAYLKHANELIDLRIKALYTLDEFETASFIMNKNLIDNNIFVLNKTHGVGGYCLFLDYSILEVYTSKQYDRYALWNPHIKILFQNLNISNTRVYKNENIKLVFMHGNMEACGLNYEEELETNIIIKLSEISKVLGIDFFIKFHPNTLEKSKEKYIILKIKEVKNIQEITNPLFITIFSTSFYDFLKFGPFLFLTDDLLNPKNIFGADIDSYHNYKNSIDIIKYYKDLINYKSLHNMQLDNINNR